MWQPNRNYPGFRFFAQYNMCALRLDLFMAQGADLGYVPKNIVMEKRDDPGSMIEPLIKLTDTEAQGLMDALWGAGMRPSSRANESDLVAAKNDHIADLRGILARIDGQFSNPEIERAG